MTETSNQVAAIKVQHKEDVRRFNFPRNGSFLELEKVLRNIFSFTPTFPLVIKYQDEEKEWVTCFSDEELFAAFDLFSPNKILRLLIDVPMNFESALVNNIAEPAFAVHVASPSVPVSPWKACKEENQNKSKEQKKHWKEQEKRMWNDWTIEERAAWIQKREAWKKRCKLEKEELKGEHKQWMTDHKMWKKNWKEQRKEEQRNTKNCHSTVHAVDGGCCKSVLSPFSPVTATPSPLILAPIIHFECCGFDRPAKTCAAVVEQRKPAHLFAQLENSWVWWGW